MSSKPSTSRYHAIERSMSETPRAAVMRTVLASYPPQTVYRLADRARRLTPALERIAAVAA